jgi:integrase
MPTITRPLTIASINSLPAAPPGQDLWVSDGRTNGLRLRVTDRGAKTWYINRRVLGKPKKYRVGAYPEISPEVAKEKAIGLLAQFEVDVDPQAERDRLVEQPTFAETFDDWLENYAKIEKRSWREDQRKYKTLIPDDWKSRRLSLITTEDVDRLRVKIGRTRRVLANRLVFLISAVYTFANKRRELNVKNPAAAVETYRENPRERWFTDDELKALLSVLPSHARPVVADAIGFVLYTGQRKGEVLKARWSEFNLESRVWTIPVEHHKGKRLHRVSLPPSAIEILRRRKVDAPAGIEWVFPASRIGRGKKGEPPPTEIGPCSILHREWDAICKAAGISGVTIHDLRRTFGHNAAVAGVPMHMLQDHMGHRDIATTQRHYARIAVEDRRAMMDAVSGRLFAAAAPVADAVPLLTA